MTIEARARFRCDDCEWSFEFRHQADHDHWCWPRKLVSIFIRMLGTPPS